MIDVAATYLINERKVAEIAALSVQYLRKMRATGQGPVFVKLGRSVRYPLNGVNDWLNAAAVGI